MENSFYVGISRQSVLQDQMDLIANNIANINTPGYRAQNMVFEEYLTKAQNNGKGLDNTDDRVSMVTPYGQFQSTAPGPVEHTGNPLDVALNGPGYLGVQTPQGIMYTRAGNFQINAKGELVTGTGQIVAGKSGGALVIPKDARQVTISSDGTVATDKGAVGQLMVSEFANEQDLDPAGNGLYKLSPHATSTAGPALNTKVVQGSLEGSNVQAITETTRMIDVLREYQATQNMLQTEHDRETTMIQQLSKVY
ncbi:MAG TPA: flagellar basal-body rod protein FlgF [Patescibacteria group bacterium]|nr:flagellar basal-body rod protein FlgF [Patescibacteria group bacterium]